MGKLAIYLPPFSSDYAGVCSTLFDFNSLIAINDGHCCTQNYVGYDEPRWNKTMKTTLCTELRTIDAVFGNDKLVVKRVSDAADSLEPDFIAVLGSPVPAIIGMDMHGIALEIEEQCTVPTFGFDTTGFNYYDKGMAMAALALFKRYAKDADTKLPDSINILGMTPLDYTHTDNGETLRQMLCDGGFRVLGSFFMGTTLQQVRDVGKAAINIAVSAGGLALAKYLHQRFQTPYIATTPMGTKHGQHVLARLHDALHDDSGTSDNPSPEKAPSSQSALLIVGDQIVANALREALYFAGCDCSIDIASFFGMVSDLRAPHDHTLNSEKDLIKLLRSGTYCGVVGDPLIELIPGVDKLEHFKLPHPAVSSRLFWNNAPVFAAHDFDTFIDDIVRRSKSFDKENMK
jgi:Nitrogenase molybdenum-iron protein, alpha and beta chains